MKDGLEIALSSIETNNIEELEKLKEIVDSRLTELKIKNNSILNMNNSYSPNNASVRLSFNN